MNEREVAAAIETLRRNQVGPSEAAGLLLRATLRSETRTCSKEEAIDLLTQKRSWLVAWGRKIAWEQCRTHGSTHSRRVYQEMEERGLLSMVPAVSGHWLGAVFASRWFDKTGEQVMVKSDRIHARPNPLWKLSSSAPESIPDPPSRPE